MGDRVACWKQITAETPGGEITGKCVTQRTKAYLEAHDIKLPVKNKAPVSGKDQAGAALSRLRAAVVDLPEAQRIEALLAAVQELIGEKVPQIAA
jgi:hypothetical protein